jgi:hypothetical protein
MWEPWDLTTLWSSTGPGQGYLHIPYVAESFGSLGVEAVLSPVIFSTGKTSVLTVQFCYY